MTDKIWLKTSKGNYEITGNVRWRDDWINAQYYVNDMAHQGGYTAVCNTDTTDQIEPTAIGSQSYLLPDAPVWSNLNNANHVYQALSVVAPEGKFYQISGFRLWVSSIAASYDYKVYTQKSDGAGGVITQLYFAASGDILSLGWNIVSKEPVFIAFGSDFDFVLETSNSAGDTTIVGGWQRESNDNNNNPAIQGWNTNNVDSVLRISTTDLDSVGRETELLSIVAGSTIQFVDVADNLISVTYDIINAPVLNVDAVTYSVAVSSTGSKGVPSPGDITNMTAVIPTPASTEYVNLTDGLLAIPDVHGKISLTGDYADAVANEDGGGIDLLFQEFQVSPDWDLLPASTSSSSGGGGVTEHNALTGIQGGDSGAGEYFHLSQLEVDRVNSRNIDGGFAAAVYLPAQHIDGGGA